MFEKLADFKNMTKTWDKLKGVPGGKTIFSKFIGFFIPYTGSISPKVMEIREGFAQVSMEDKRCIRNHLNSIHAIALANLGEFTTGLATMSALPKGAQMILTNISIEYLKKARGTLISEAHAQISKNVENNATLDVKATIRDAEKNIVTTVTASWRIRVK